MLIFRLNMRFVLGVFLLYSTNAFSQEIRKEVYLNVVPSHAFILIDGEKQENNSMISLNYGKHIINYWAPNMKEVIDTFVVKDTTESYKGHLFFTEDYRNYSNKLENFTIFKTIRVKVPFYTSLISTGLCINSILNYKKHEKESVELFNKTKIVNGKYTSLTPGEYQKDKENYLLYLESTRKIKREAVLVNSFGLLTIAAGTISYYYFKKLNKKVPVKPKIVKPIWLEY